MAQTIDPGIDALEARFRAAQGVVERTHCQVVWLLARGYTIKVPHGAWAVVAKLTGIEDIRAPDNVLALM
jgi:hypothetical protein